MTVIRTFNASILKADVNTAVIDKGGVAQYSGTPIEVNIARTLSSL